MTLGGLSKSNPGSSTARTHRILCILSCDIASSHVMMLSLPNAQAECRVTLKGAPPRARMEVLWGRGRHSSTAALTGAFDRSGDGQRCTFQHSCNKNSKSAL
jgi:hypothetical protein